MKYVFIDTETGGVYPERHSLLSIGIVIWDIKTGIIDQTEIFIKHKEYAFTKESQKINKFDKRIHEKKAILPLATISAIDNILKKHFDVNEKPVLIGHNVQFDVNFLKEFYRSNGRSYNKRFSHRMIDTNSIIRIMIIGNRIPSNLRNLSDALKYFDIHVPTRHSALDDCVATVSLFEKLLGMIECNHPENTANPTEN